MSGAEISTGASSGNNASEFVRKLYRMLEDPSHQDVARWGKGGDTFIVEDGEKFTRTILPKHFKHSNMSSFIRQLNKYDFHKVKPASDSEAAKLNCLEFKHPFFRVDSKDDLDNIRRKAPAPRKTQVTEDYTASQHISVLSEQITAQQQQVQQLQEMYGEVSQTNKFLVNEIISMKQFLSTQKQAQIELLNLLSHFNSNGHSSNGVMNQSLTSQSDNLSDTDEQPELRRARELLATVVPDQTAERELERLHNMYGGPNDTSAMMSHPMHGLHDPMSDLNRYPVYPVGQTIGIDPFHSDHIHKIPYSLPQEASAPMLAEAPASQPLVNQMTPAEQPTPVEKLKDMWGPKKPSVFLVEDDRTCAQIGIKFLQSMGCEVEHALNGADAVTRMSSVSRDHFDVIFMDIIMPRLDGVSATLYIRGTHPSVPIIAMTSNIRPEEVNGYFEHGMNGVLAKPFTREGMEKSVRAHASHLLKNPPQNENHGWNLGGGAYLNTQGLNASGNSLKFETPTPPSGTGAASTWSPAGMQQPSPIGSGVDSGFGTMSGGQQQFAMAGNRYTSIHGDGARNDYDDPPEKRQRLNGPTGY